MKDEKRKNYRLTGSFHTLEIKSPSFARSEDEEIDRCISTRWDSKGEIATSKINPNKLVGDALSFSEFRQIMEAILYRSGVDSYRISRADMRFDNYDNDHYRQYFKLHRYLLSAIAITYGVTNRYKTTELITEAPLSIAVKSDGFQVETYNRKHKNMVTGNTGERATARLEERTTGREWQRINREVDFADSDWNMEALQQEFTKEWDKRWKEAKKNLKRVQDTYNDALIEAYKSGLDSKPVQFRSLTDFLIQKQDCIFTSRQMVDLLHRLGVDNPENRAKYHKKKYGIEYFSQEDVNFAIREIRRAALEFFRK